MYIILNRNERYSGENYFGIIILLYIQNKTTTTNVFLAKEKLFSQYYSFDFDFISERNMEKNEKDYL